MSLFSLRILISGLALSCIVITAAICTVIAVLSGDSALTQTKDAAAEGLRQSFDQGDSALNRTRAADGEAISTCFAGATEAITQRTNELLRTTANQVAGQLLDTQYNHMRLVLKWYDFIVTEEPLSNTDTNAFLDTTTRSLWSEYRQYMPTGLTSLQIITYRNPPSVGKTRALFEDSMTTRNPPDGVHHIRLGIGDGTPGNYGYGTALPGGKLNYTRDPVWDAYFDRLPGGGLEDPDCRLRWTSKVTGKQCFLPALPGCRNGVFMHTQGRLDDGICRLLVEMVETPAIQLIETFWPVGQPRVTPITSFGIYLGIAIGMVWGTATRKIGHVLVAIDMEAYNTFLQSIQVGGKGARSRISIIGEDSWLHRMVPIPQFDVRNYMVAVSKGNSSTFVQMFTDDTPSDEYWWYEQRLRLAVQAQDPLIRAAARHIETNVNGSYAAMVGTVSSFQMNSTLAGGGWVEDVPGPKHPSMNFYPPVKAAQQYINGYSDPKDEARAPLEGYAADGEEFFIAVQRLQSRLTGRKPTYFPSDPTTGQAEWFLVVSIDREYVLGDTDRQQASTKQEIEENNERIATEVVAGTQRVRTNIQKSNDDVQESLDLDRMILYIVVAGSAVLLMVLSMVFAVAIVSPINVLRIEMAQVAVMKLEVVDEKRPINSIEEVGNMQSSFLKMVQNLREYRSYMPASVLVDTDEEEDEVEPEKDKEREQLASEHDDKVSQRHSSGGGSRRSQSTQASRLCASQAQQEAEAAQRAKHATAVGLLRKSPGFMVFNVISFNSLTKTGGAASVLELSGALLTALVEGVRASKGIPDAFNADRFYASWNTVRPAAQPRCAAARTSLVLTDSLQSALGAAKGSWACGGGDVLCGNMGIDGMKKYCCVGISNSFIHLIEPCNAIYQTKLLIDGRTKQDVENTMFVRTMALLKYKGGDMRIFQVCGNKKMDEDEWMYQLEAAEKSDPNRVFSEAMELAFKEEYSGAVAMLRGDENQTPQHDLMIADLSARL